MARAKKAAAPAVENTEANPLQAALDAAGVEGAVESCAMGEDGITCTVSGIYDFIQRQGRSDEALIALAVESYVICSARRAALEG